MPAPRQGIRHQYHHFLYIWEGLCLKMAVCPKR
jgi:hypothetical protein